MGGYVTPRIRRQPLLSVAAVLTVGIALPASALAALDPAHDAQVSAWGLDAGGADGATPVLHVALGREASVPLGVTYNSDAVTAGPVTVVTTLPAGLTFVRASALVPEAPGVTARWVCDPQGQRVQCELRAEDGVAPFPLEYSHTAHLMMVVRATDVPVVPKGGDRVPVGDIATDVSVPDGLDLLTASTTVAVVASDREATPRFHVGHVARRGSSPTGPSAREGYDLYAHNTGQGPARSAGKRPALVLFGVVPSVVLSGITVEGDGWHCRPAGHFTCSYGRPIAHGRTAPPLRVRWAPRHDAKAIDEVWTIDGTASYVDSQSAAATIPFESNDRLLLAATVVQLAVHARVSNGLHIVGGSAPRQMHVALTNVGAAHARAAGVRLRVPAGITVAPATPGWNCRGIAPRVRCTAPGALKSHQTTHLVLNLSAPSDAPTASGAVRVEPIGPFGHVRGAEHEIAVVVLDPGEAEVTPTVSFLRHGSFEQWRDGGVEQPAAGDTFTYRISLENTGGVAIRPGDRVTLRQVIGPAMGAVAVSGGPGMRCDQGRPSCTVDVSAPVAPGAVFGHLTVTTHPAHVGAQSALGAITTTVDGTRGRESLPMNVEVVDNPDSLTPGMRVMRDPTAGGIGTLVMVVKNTGASAVHAVHAVATIPEGLQAIRVEAPGSWACRIASSRVSCVSRQTVSPNGRTAGVTIHVAATGTRAESRIVGLSADGRAADGDLQRGRRQGVVPIRGPIAAVSSVTPRVVTGAGGEVGRRVALDGAASSGSGVALEYEWSQRCLTAADARSTPQCHGVVTAAARIADPHMASTSAALPEVNVRTTFVFALRITDGSATRTSTVSVISAVPQRAMERTVRSSGLSPDAAAQRANIISRTRAGNRDRRSAARQARTARRAHARSAARQSLAFGRHFPRVSFSGDPVIAAGQGDDVALQTAVAGWWGDGITYAWSQVSGAPAELTATDGPTASVNAPDAEGAIVLRVVARDTVGHGDTSQITVMVGAPPSMQGGQVLLAAFRAARASAPLPISLGDNITGTLRNLKGSRSGDTGSYAFTASDLAVGQMTIQGASGSLDASVITLTGGTLLLPDAWGITPIAITAKSPLAILFAAGDHRAALVGEVRAPTSFALFALPIGWAGHSTLTFAPGAWRVTSSARGGDDGTATLEGALWSDGTYEVNVDSTKLVDIAGTLIDLAGAAGNHTGTAHSTVSGSIVAPIQLGDGVSVDALTATWAPGATPKGTPAPIIRGAATLVLASGDVAPLSLGTSLSYASPLDWRVTLTGRGGDAWSPLPNLRVTPKDLAGYVGDADGARQWGVTGRVRTWQASSLVAMSNVRLSLTDVCAADASPACPAAGLFVKMQGDATLTTAETGAVKARADAILGLGESGGFSLTAALPDLQLGPGVRIGAPALDVSYGMPRDLLPSATGRPSFTGDTNDGFGVRAIGSLTLPSLGAFASVTADATARGWTLGAYAPDGVALGAGNGRQAKAWFGWASYDTAMDAPVAGGDPIHAPVARDFVSAVGMYVAADWFSALVAHTPDAAVSIVRLDPAAGTMSGDVALSGEFAMPVGASKLTASDVVLGIRGTSAGVAVSARARGDLQVKGADGAFVSAPAFDMALSGDAPLHTATGTLTVVGGGDWDNAFAVPGLVLRAPSLALSVDTTSRAAQLRLMGGATLPAGLTDPIHTPSATAPIAVAADLAAPDSCVDVQVGDTSGAASMMSMGGGALHARFYEFVIAPTGCRLSATSPVLRPGLSLVFDADVMGTTVDVAAPITLSPQVVIDDTVRVGSLLVGALRLSDTDVTMRMDGGAGVDEVGLGGNVTIFNTPVRVQGAITGSGPTSGVLSGSAGAPVDVSGFSVRDLALQVSVQSGPGGGAASVGASGDMTVMGDVVHVPTFITVIDNGVIEDVSFSQQANVNIHGRATAAGVFTMHHRASNGQMAVTGDAIFTTTAGIAVGTAAAPAHLIVDPRCAAISGTTTIAGVATAAVAGTIAHADGCATQVRSSSGAMVVAGVGDFGLVADHVVVNVDSARSFGTVALGNIGGIPYATLATPLALSPQDTNANVPVSGTFTPGGDLLLTGHETVDVASFSVPLTITAKREGGQTTISGAGNLDVAGNQVHITGAFMHDGTVPHATFAGEVDDLVLGGYHLSKATLTLIDTPTEKGFNAVVDGTWGETLGGNATGKGNITLLRATGGQILFHGSLVGHLEVPYLQQTADGTIDIGNCTGDCTTAGPTSASMRVHITEQGIGFDMKIAFNTDGSFEASANSGPSFCIGQRDIGVAYIDGCFDAHLTLTVRSRAPYAHLDTGVSAWFAWKTSIAGPNWHRIDVNLNLSLQLVPLRICARVLGFNVCVP